MEFYKVNDKNNLEPSDKKQFQARIEENCSLHLVFIFHEELEQQKNFIEALCLHPLILEKLIHNGEDIGAIPYKDAILIQLPVSKTWEDNVNRYGTIVCIPNSLIFFIEKIQASGRKLLADLSNTDIVSNLNAASIIYLIISRQIDNATVLVKQARKEINGFFQQLEQDRSDSSDYIKNLKEFKGKVDLLEETLDDLHRCVNSLLGTNSPTLELKEVEVYFRDLLSQIEHSLRQTERIKDELKTVYQYYLLKLQDASSRRLNILTIVSAIFMPLTLIAGIYGMNFKTMPELEWQFGYHVVLISMLIISICLILTFYLKGWFDNHIRRRQD